MPPCLSIDSRHGGCHADISHRGRGVGGLKNGHGSGNEIHTNGFSLLKCLSFFFFSKRYLCTPLIQLAVEIYQSWNQWTVFFRIKTASHSSVLFIFLHPKLRTGVLEFMFTHVRNMCGNLRWLISPRNGYKTGFIICHFTVLKTFYSLINHCELFPVL